MMVKEKLQILSVAFIIISMIVIGGGCGKKAPPIPPAEKMSNHQSVIASKY